MNEITGKPFEQLHREYQTYIPDRSQSYKVTWYRPIDNEFQELTTRSRELAARLAADYHGSFTTVG